MYNCHQEQEHFNSDIMEDKLQNLYEMINGSIQAYRELCSEDQDSDQQSMFNQEIEEEILSIHILYHRLVTQLGYKTQNMPSFAIFQNASQYGKLVANNCQLGNTQLSRNPNSVELSKQKQRGRYRSYTRQQKNHVVFLHQAGNSFAYISKQLNIPQKNVVRWCREGYSESETNKRLADSEMERVLADWLQSHPERSKLCYSDIQKKALELSLNPIFKASRGWMRNFLKRRDPMLLKMIASSSKTVDEEK